MGRPVVAVVGLEVVGLIGFCGGEGAVRWRSRRSHGWGAGMCEREGQEMRRD